MTCDSRLYRCAAHGLRTHGENLDFEFPQVLRARESEGHRGQTRVARSLTVVVGR